MVSGAEELLLEEEQHKLRFKSNQQRKAVMAKISAAQTRKDVAYWNQYLKSREKITKTEQKALIDAQNNQVSKVFQSKSKIRILQTKIALAQERQKEYAKDQRKALAAKINKDVSSWNSVLPNKYKISATEKKQLIKASVENSSKNISNKDADRIANKIRLAKFIQINIQSK